MFTGVTYADPCFIDCSQDVTLEDSPELAPPVTVEVLTETVTVTTTLMLKYIDNIMNPITSEKGGNVQSAIMSFQYAITDLSTLDVDVTALRALFEDADVNFNMAGSAYRKCIDYVQMGDMLSAEANTVEGVDALVLRLKASLSYCVAASYAEQCDTALNTVLEISEQGQLLYEELSTPVSPDEDNVTGRYHPRTHTEDFFRRSRSRKV
jgi:hypothetical protein